VATTDAEKARLRRDIGGDATSLPDGDIDDIFDEAAERYTDAASIVAYTRVLAIQGLLASSAKLTSYRQNESQESLSDVFKHVGGLLKVWEGKTDDAVAAASTSGAARFGSVRRKPARIREYPGEV
jgi:hypothetical protein